MALEVWESRKVQWSAGGQHMAPGRGRPGQGQLPPGGRCVGTPVLEVCCAVLRCLLSFKQAPAGARATPVIAMATALVRDALQQGDRGEAAALLKRWQLPAAYAAFAGLTDGEQADLLKMLRQEGEQNLREQLAAAAGAAAGAPPPQPAPSRGAPRARSSSWRRPAGTRPTTRPSST